MRRFVTIAAAAVLIGCGQEPADMTCGELQGDPAKAREMTDEIQELTGSDRGKVRAMWETICVNARPSERERARPYALAVRLLQEHD